MRIVSLSPAISETLSLLGAEDEIVGVTPWCRMYLRKKDIAVAGTYIHVNMEILRKLRPDIIFLQSHVQDKLYDALRSEGFRTYLIPLPTNLLDIVSNVEFISTLVDRYWEGKDLADKLLDQVIMHRRVAKERPRVYVEYLWPDKTFSTAGNLTYIDDALRLVGAVNIFVDKKLKFFTPSDEEILSRDPEIILVNIERFPTHGTYNWFQLFLIP